MNSTWFDTKISFKNPKLSLFKSFEMKRPQTYGAVNFFMLDGWDATNSLSPKRSSWPFLAMVNLHNLL